MPKPNGSPPAEIYDPTDIRVYLGTEAKLPASTLDKHTGNTGAMREDHPNIRLELHDQDSCCVVHMRLGHFAFLENRIQAVRRALDALAGPGPVALTPTPAGRDIDGFLGERRDATQQEPEGADVVE